MKCDNHTPFPHLVFESRTKDDKAFAVAVVRGTFRIAQGEPLRPTPAQDAVQVEDVHRREGAPSSLAMEADLAPFKPRTDIHLDAVAHAPEGRPCAEWPVRVLVGDLLKDLLVRGPHVWQHHLLGGWKRIAPVKCLSVPLTYERAFGGSLVLQGKAVREPRNPVGTGLITDLTPRDADVPAPQVLALCEPEHVAGRRYVPQGTGPLSPGWQPRLAKAGTFDARWREERWPRLPADFDAAFYNSAHPDLIYPGYVRGDEQVHLVNMCKGAPVIAFSLPRYAMVGVGRCASGLWCRAPLALDTIHVDVRSEAREEHRVHLTWRGVFPLEPAVLGLELRMDHPGRRRASAPVANPLGASHG